MGQGAGDGDADDDEGADDEDDGDDDDDDVKRLLMVQCLVQWEGESLILEVGQFMNIIGSL